MEGADTFRRDAARGMSAALEIEQHLAPALRALMVAVGEAQNHLAAPFVSADQHQKAPFFLGHARLEGKRPISTAAAGP